MYEKSQESLKKRSPVHEVIYDVLSELEKKFDMSLLGALFSKTIMKTYPDLFRIYKIFYKVIPVIKFLLKSDGGEEYEERPNERLSLEQGVKCEAQARTDCNQASDIIGTVHLGNKSTLEKSESKKSKSE
uniref:HSR domain-containing protein n=1 Tax=Pipistrellus kuhlii TaxID=59472 RepID=A0A7J7XVT8_PIPKU|nr:hypothetical protein mPipKuh1_010450 [Pipistrellus kuhlii]